MLYLQPILSFIMLCSFIVFGCNHSNETIHDQSMQKFNFASKLDSQFQYHFHILDSIESIGFKDSSLFSQGSIDFMEEHTRIDGEADGTYFGTLYFTANDLAKWHRWYELHKDSIRTIRDNP